MEIKPTKIKYCFRDRNISKLKSIFIELSPLYMGHDGAELKEGGFLPTLGQPILKREPITIFVTHIPLAKKEQSLEEKQSATQE